MQHKKIGLALVLLASTGVIKSAGILKQHYAAIAVF